MNVALPLLGLGLVLGGGVGFAIAAANGIALDGHDHASHAAAPGAVHGHDAPLILPPDETPRLDVTVTPDPASGWNVHIDTDLTFSPQNASGAHVPGEGHAHVYANGVKLGRYYGPWVHIADLPAGEVTLEVTLNANDHRPLWTEGAALARTVVIENP